MRWKNIRLWLNERFPVINFISGFFLYLLARSVVEFSFPQLNLSWSLRDLCGMLVPAAHLFLLRVFDEHKDFSTDKIYYPHRVVQRGLVSLAEIRQLGYLAFAVQLVCFILLNPTKLSIALYVLLWSWTILMNKEFFLGEWLKKQLLLYGLLHLLITPILLLLLFNLVADFSFQNHSGIYTLILSFLTGWLYELARKTKGKDEETGDLSYSKIWGPQKSMVILSISIILSLIFTAIFFRSLGINKWFNDLALLAFLILTFLVAREFALSASSIARKKNEKVVALISMYIFMFPVVISFL